MEGDKRAAPRAQRLGLWQTVIFTCGIVCALLVLCEGALRLVDFFQQGTPLDQEQALRIIPAPYVMYTAKPNFTSQAINTDQSGLRVVPQSPVQSEQLFRIAVFGGSSVFGQGASSDAMTVAAQLQAILQERLPETRIEVVNAGQVGYNAAQSLNLYQMVVSRYQPDAVVQLDGYNDFFHALLNQAPPLEPPMWSDTHAKRAMDAYMTAWFTREDLRILLAKISFSSAIVRSALQLYFSRISPLIRPQVSVDQAVPDRGIEEYADAYVRMSRYFAAAAAADGVSYIGAFQPLFIDRGVRSAAEQEYASQSEWRLSLVHRVRQTMDVAEKQFAQQSKETAQLHRVDIRATVTSSTEQLFVDDVHLTDAGHRHVAEGLADVIAPLIPEQMRVHH